MNGSLYCNSKAFDQSCPLHCTLEVGIPSLVHLNGPPPLILSSTSISLTHIQSNLGQCIHARYVGAPCGLKSTMCECVRISSSSWVCRHVYHCNCNDWLFKSCHLASLINCPSLHVVEVLLIPLGKRSRRQVMVTLYPLSPK